MSSSKLFFVVLAFAAVFGVVMFVLPHGVDKAPEPSATFFEIVVENDSSEEVQIKWGFPNVGETLDGATRRIETSMVPWTSLVSSETTTICASSTFGDFILLYRPKIADAPCSVVMFSRNWEEQSFVISDDDVVRLRKRAEAEKSASGSAQAAPSGELTLAEMKEYERKLQDQLDRLSTLSGAMAATAAGVAEAAAATATPPKQE